MIATNIDTVTVTAEQIGACHKVFGPDSKPSYLVENSQGELDQDGQIIEYKVTFSVEHGYQCTCKAGQEGFARCKNFCWHVRAAVACAREEKQAMAEQARLNAEQVQVIETPAQTVVTYTDVDAQTLARIQRRDQERKERKPVATRNRGYATRPAGFSMFK